MNLQDSTVGENHRIVQLVLFIEIPFVLAYTIRRVLDFQRESEVGEVHY